MTQLYAVAAYLLGKPLLPLKMRLNLVAAGQGIEARVYRRSARSVPLEFTFWYPVATMTASAARQALEQALLYSVTTTGYEFQHVEYAVGDSLGPPSPQGQSFLKNETNSACWKLATRLRLPAGQSVRIAVPRVTRGDLESDARAFGNTVRKQTAAVWGPALVQHDLGKYLAAIRPTDSRGSPLQISARVDHQINAVLAYCRGFTRYDGDIAKEPIPPNRVAHTRFWKDLPTRKQELQ